MREIAQEKCKYCGRDLSNLEIYEICACKESIEFNNQIGRNASEKRWDAYYKGRQDKRNHKVYYNIYLNKDEALMYELGWNNVKNKKNANKRKN